MDERDKKAHILLVDDETAVRDVMAGLLESAGYSVHVAANGQEGLKAFFVRKPDLVVLDLMMPVMDGWNLLERIREVSEVPIIVLTALGQEDVAVRALRGGADDYVVKPSRLSEFRARVEALLRKSPTPSTATELNPPADDTNITIAREKSKFQELVHREVSHILDVAVHAVVTAVVTAVRLGWPAN